MQNYNAIVHYLKLFAYGGVTDTSHIPLFAHAGADVVMNATGVMYNPNFHSDQKVKVNYEKAYFSSNNKHTNSSTYL